MTTRERIALALEARAEEAAESARYYNPPWLSPPGIRAEVFREAARIAREMPEAVEEAPGIPTHDSASILKAYRHADDASRDADKT